MVAWEKGDMGRIVAVAFVAIWALFFLSCLIDHSTIKSFMFIASEYFGAWHYDLFMDFFNCVKDALARGFDGAYNSIYPPIVNLAYTAIGAVIGNQIKADPSGSLLFCTLQGLAAYAICVVVGLLILLVSVFKMGRNRSLARRAVACFVVVANVPLLYAILRGNSCVFAFAFLMVFFSTKDHESAALRHLGYVCFALSICIKIYPVLFGLLLLRDKDKWPVLWCAIYTAILFFVPFLAYNGVDTFFEMFESLTGTQTFMDGKGFGFFVDATNTIDLLLCVFAGPDVSLVAPWTTVIRLVLLVVAIIGALGLRDNWKAATLIGLVVALLPGFSAMYNLTFVLPGLLLFMDERNLRIQGAAVGADETRARRWMLGSIAYLVLFVLLFVPIPFGSCDVFPDVEGCYRVTTCCLVESCVAIVSFVVFGAQGIAQGTMRVACRERC